SVNELVVAVTGSLKFTTMFVFTATWSAASAGEVVVTVGAASCVANEKLVFAAGWSGGAAVWAALVLAATGVTVQVAVGRSAVGSSVIDDPGDPLTLKLFAVPVGHSSVNELELTVTDSLQLMTMLVFTATWSAPSAGDVLDTAGAASAVVKLKT